MQSTRANVYHTNSNIAHEELRDLIKPSQCRDIGEVVAYFDHMRVLKNDHMNSTQNKSKSKRCVRDCTGDTSLFKFLNEVEQCVPSYK